MKYIVTKDSEGKEEIFTFPSTINHDNMMRRIMFIEDSFNEEVLRRPISAGFIRGGNCVGSSETLGLDSRGEVDTMLLDT